MSPLFVSHLPSLKRLHQGKVRDMYEVDEAHLLIVATDRLSAFDVVLPTPIPDKGRILTAMANFWFARTAHIIPNHLTARRLEDILPADEAAQVRERAVIVRRLTPLPVEAIVRGYISGSAWLEYQQLGTVCGLALPAGLQESARLPEAIFTPSTKAPAGQHDSNIAFAEMVKILDGKRALAEQIRDTSLRLYQEAVDYALRRGIIIADTKFEFGLFEDQLYLMDEVLTPDSSRFWPLATYKAGQGQASFDKQYVRDYLTSTGWNKRPPAPPLPESIVAQTTHKYQEALRLLTADS